MASSAATSKSSNSRRRDRKKEMQGSNTADVSEDLIEILKEYARKNPEKAALWCLGIGFILGWKLKPW